MGFWMGDKEKTQQLPAMSPEQINYLNQMMGGLGGVTPSIFNYLQDLFSESPEAMERFKAPMMREFQENIIPGLAEQFSGMGSGGAQSSSAFQQALGGAGAGLSERLGAMREQLRGQGMQAAQGFGQTAMGAKPFGYHTQAAQPGFLQSIVGPLIGAAGTAAGGWLGRGKTIG